MVDIRGKRDDGGDDDVDDGGDDGDDGGDDGDDGGDDDDDDGDDDGDDGGDCASTCSSIPHITSCFTPPTFNIARRFFFTLMIIKL